MIQLFLDVNGWKVAELYQNEPVNLTYRFTDLTEVNKAASNYSQTFRLPLTKANADIFGEVTLGQVPPFRYKAKIPARIVRSGLTLLEGFAQVKGFYQSKGKFTDVELTFFGEGSDLSRAIGDRMLTDLDLSAYDYTATKTNTLNGLGASGLSSGAIRLGMVDRGFNWDESTAPFQTGARATMDQATPFVRVRELLEAIFEEAGCTFESSWLDSEDALYLMALAAQDVYTTAVYAFNRMYVGRSTNASISAATWTNLVLGESTPFYDPDGLWSSDTFTVPVTGYYSFSVRLQVGLPQTYQFRYVGSTSGASTPINFTASTTNFAFFEFTALLVAGETITFQIQAPSAFTLIGQANDRLSTFVRLRQYWQTEDFEVNVAANLPKLKQIEFVAGLQQAFNLVFIPDRNRPRHYFVEPFTDYFSGGAVKDWTPKLDQSKDLHITPTTDLQKRKYIWTHAESEDLVNSAAKENEGEVYGTFTIEDTANDYAQGEQKVQVPFAPWITTELLDVPLMRMLKATATNNVAIEKPKPFLCYYAGDSDGRVYFKSNGYGDFDDEAPIFSAYKQYRAIIKTESLYFGFPAPYHDTPALPLRSLYFWYWADWFNQLYSEDARLLTAHFRLTTEDVAAFTFADKIYLFNQYWRVLEISNFDATQDGVTQVKLLKVLGTVPDCADVPDSAVAGIVSGAIASLSKTCCERYGYIYDPDTLRCLVPPENTL